jgi:Chemotaxis protein histidine kinase and related kinases
MEDCFVAAQNQTILLGADQIDILLHGVDLLLNISQIENNHLNTWLLEQGHEMELTYQQITTILDSGQVFTQLIPLKTEVLEVRNPPNLTSENQNLTAIVPETQNLKLEIQPPKSEPSDRVVRVSADNLNRIMGLAGESLIESNWLQPFADSLTILKKRHLELSKIMENLQESLVVGQSGQKNQTQLEAARAKERECREILGERLNELELYARRTANLSDRLYREVIASHMRPFADGVQGFPRMIRDLARKLGKQVKLEILGKATPVDRDILKKLESPLTHILRNSVDHGFEIPEERLSAGKTAEGTLRLEAVHRGGMLSITISDDGKGIDIEQLRKKVINKNLATPEIAAQLTESELIEFLFLPGFSTAKQVTEISGRGVGLDIARSMAQEVGGTVRGSSQLGKGMIFHFQLPLTLSVVRTLLVEISGEPYAFPLARIEQIVMVDQAQIYSVENRQYFTMDNRNIGLVAASQVLELKESAPKFNAFSVVIISEQSDYYGLVVDRFLGEHDLVVRPLDPRLGKVQDISAAALMGDRTPILIVDVSDLVHSVDHLLKHGNLRRFSGKNSNLIKDNRQRILVVDDSITVREMERKLLENKGYKVDVAVNGLEGWYSLSSNKYDLVVSDVDMPRMNGIELVTKIKNHPTLQSIPVIIVSYKDRDEDRLQGLEAGADYYLTKTSFHDNTLLQAVVDLIGDAKT